MYTITHTQLLSHLRAICIDHVFYCLILQNDNILLHKHSAVAILRKFNLECCFLIYNLYSSFIDYSIIFFITLIFSV